LGPVQTHRYLKGVRAAKFGRLPWSHTACPVGLTVSPLARDSTALIDGMICLEKANIPFIEIEITNTSRKNFH
jgi:hypothetical protein